MDDEANLALAGAYIDATRTCDLEALVELMGPGSVVWHNHDEREVDAAATAKTLGWLHHTVADISWETIEVLSTATGFVWRSVLTGTAPGGPLRVHSCLVAVVSASGCIERADEYLDSGALSVLSR